MPCSLSPSKSGISYINPIKGFTLYIHVEWKTLMVSRRNHMFVIIKNGENVNVCIHDFDDVKEESNKAASMSKKNLTRLLQMISICFKNNSRLLQQTKPCFKIH